MDRGPNFELEVQCLVREACWEDVHTRLVVALAGSGGSRGQASQDCCDGNISNSDVPGSDWGPVLATWWLEHEVRDWRWSGLQGKRWTLLVV